jgi:hypothetical protein
MNLSSAAAAVLNMYVHMQSCTVIACVDLDCFSAMCLTCLVGPAPLQVFELPSVLAYPLFYKLVAPEASLVSQTAMQAWVLDKELVSLDVQSRMMEVRFGAYQRHHRVCMQRMHLHSCGHDPTLLHAFRCRMAAIWCAYLRGA